MKYLLMFDTPLWMILSITLAVYAWRLRRRIAGLNDPRLYLSKAERRAWARKQLQQQQEDQDAAQLERLTNIVNQPPNPLLPNSKDYS